VLVYTLKILMKLVTSGTWKSAVGHEHVNVKKIETFINYQPSILKIKFTFRSFRRNNCCWQKGGRRRCLLIRAEP